MSIYNKQNIKITLPGVSLIEKRSKIKNDIYILI